MTLAFKLTSPEATSRRTVRLPRKLDQGIRETASQYNLEPEEEKIVALALQILERQIKREAVLNDPQALANYLKLKLSGQASESFNVLWLDNRHRAIAFEQLFTGTVNGASVHPREVVRAALSWNACAVVLAHNHPSGVCEPSHSDRVITRELAEALKLVGVLVLDHFVVGGNTSTSFASRGWL